MSDELENTRVVLFQPYLDGKGPKFVLSLWDTGRIGEGDIGTNGKSIMGYQLTMDKTVLFSGEDFFCSPMYEPCSDEVVEELMSFLTLKPDDMEDEYFERHKYGPVQMEYAENHAEMLSMEVSCRFGEDRDSEDREQ